jgi:exosortase/archaeosortase family protein
MLKLRGRVAVQAAIATCGAVWLLQWARAWEASGEPAWTGIFTVLVLAWLLIARPAAGSSTPAGAWVPACGMAALIAALVVRPWLEPFPGWPLADWVFSLALFGFVWTLVAAAQGLEAAHSWIRPMLFALAALPWPAAVAVGLMGRLRSATATALADGFTWAGHPVVAEGTAMRMARGTIGLDEACGGIHSLQTAVLLSLAIGAMERARLARQMRLVLVGVALALGCNALRLAGLAWICEIGGNAAVERWHDGFALFEFAAVLLGFAVCAAGGRWGATSPRSPFHALALPKSPRAAALLAAVALVLVPVEEVGVQRWFARAGRPAGWARSGQIELPTQLASYSAEPWTPAMQALLRCDAHQVGTLTDADGRRREGYTVQWRNNPHAAQALATHTPTVCLPLAGNTPLGARPPVFVESNGFRWWFSVAAYAGRFGRFELYHRTEVEGENRIQAPAESNGADPWGIAARWQEVSSGRRGISAQAVAIAIFDAAGPAEADRQFRAEFARLLRPPSR